MNVRKLLRNFDVCGEGAEYEGVADVAGGEVGGGVKLKWGWSIEAFSSAWTRS